MTLRTALTNKQTIGDGVMSLCCLPKHPSAVKNRVISEKTRGLIRSRKVVEAVRSSRRASDGRWSKIE